MRIPESFTHREVQDLARAVRAGAAPVCPVCAVLLDETAVPPREDVSYVRDRVWLVCPTCHRTAVVDRRWPIARGHPFHRGSWTSRHHGV